ncbi:MAG: PilW family protein [Candidatus Methylomirabilales bacterium]
MNSQGRQRGFTLLEILVSSAIFGIVLGAIYIMYVTNQTTFARGENKIELQQNARVAMERMAREIRMAGYDPSGAIPAQPVGQQTAIQVADANTITFIADVDGDNSNPADTVPDSDQVTFQLQGTQVIRDISSWLGGPWTPDPPTSSELADGVRPAADPAGPGLTFMYFDGSDTPIITPVPAASLGNIRRITLVLTTQATAAGRQETFTLTMDVRLRNL